MRLECHPYQHEKDIGLNQRDLFKLAFPEAVQTTVSTLDHYRWKFHSFPALPRSFEYAAFEGPKMLGYYAALPYQYKLGSQKMTCGMVCDVMTHPESRGKGVFVQLGHYATDSLAQSGLDITTGYPIRPEVLPGHLKVGWEVLHELPMYLRPLKSRTLLPKGLQFTVPAVDGVIRLVNKLFLRSSSEFQFSLCELDELVKNEEGYNHFLNQWLNENKIALIKDLDFLRWRFAAPDTRYVFLKVLKGDKIVGLIAMREVVLKGVSCLALLDFMILNQVVRFTKDIHTQIFNYAKAKDVDAIVIMASLKSAQRVGLNKNFFIRTPAVFKLIVKRLNLDIDMNLLRDINAWSLFWIDSDDL